MINIKDIYDRKLIKAILAYISNYYDIIEEDITVEPSGDDYTYYIGDESYFIIDSCAEDSILEDFNDEYFRNSMHKYIDIMEYINKDLWISKNGLENFDDYIEQEYDRSVSYEDTINGYNFYLITK